MRKTLAALLVASLPPATLAQDRIELINDPLFGGIVIEDGVAGYEYVYDLFLGSGAAGAFQLGGAEGPLGVDGAFVGADSAWYRVPSDPAFSGMYQVWWSTSTSMTWSAAWNDPAAYGILPADTWDAASVLHHNGASGIGPLFTPGAPVPWARDNPWHLPSEYGSTSEYFFPGPGFGATATGDEGLAYHTVTGIFIGGPTELQATLRVVAPYAPGQMNWYLDAPKSGQALGPTGAPVVHLAADVPAISISSGGVQTLDLYAPRSFAGDLYLLLGSQSGTSPGIPFDGVTIPLNFDVYTQFVLGGPTTPPFGGGLGTLDADGNAQVTITVPAGAAPPSFIGFQVQHACLVLDATGGPPLAKAASNATTLDFTP